MRLNRLRLLEWAAMLLTLAASAAAAEPTTTARRGDHETVTFSMYCYWTGEATVGRVDGVIASRIGHWGGSEIVEVDFDPQRTGIDELIAALEAQRSFYAVVLGEADDGPGGAGALEAGVVVRRTGGPRFIEPKHSLRTRHPELAALDLSEAQAMALNSWSYFGGPMPEVLTADQKQRLRQP